MKTGIIAAVDLCFLVMTVSAETVRVTGDNVNLRAAPTADSEVVLQVMQGDELKAAGREGEWIKIVPPEKTSLWVYGELVRDDVVAVSKLRVRAGQGANYKSVGYLEKGTKLEVRSRPGDWLEIAPPEGSYLWISADYVVEIKNNSEPVPEEPKLVPKQHQVPQHDPEQKAVEKPVVQVPARKPPLPETDVPIVRPSLKPVNLESSGLSSAEQYVLKKDEISQDMAAVLARLRPDEGKGRVVQYKGTLRKSSLVWHRPSKYRLIMNDEKGRAYTICYVLGSEKRLADYVGRVLLVYGREYWVDGVRYSVVVPEQLITQD